MTVLTVIWALDAVSISEALNTAGQIFLLFGKYCCAFPILAIYFCVRDGFSLPKKGDVGWLILSMLFGDICYFFCEYSALKFLPTATATLCLGVIPGFSYLTDCVINRQRPKISILLLMILMILGLAPVVSASSDFFSGHLLGYLACIGCAAAWIAYGRVINRLDRTMSSTAITFWQQLFAIIAMSPIALSTIPHDIPLRDILICIVAMGILSNGLGFLIEIRGFIDLGSTVTAIYLNVLPVFTAIAGFIFLHEQMSLLQCIGAAVVIICGCLIILRSTESAA